MSEQAQIGPQPTPQQVVVSTVQGDGRSFVVVQILGPTGTHVTFLDPEAASAIAAKIEKAAATARTGLVVAQGLARLNGQSVGKD